MKWFTDWIQQNTGLFVGLVIGLAVAILFLTIGFWATVLIGICMWIGGSLGAKPEMREAIGRFFRRIGQELSDRVKGTPR